VHGILFCWLLFSLLVTCGVCSTLCLALSHLHRLGIAYQGLSAITLLVTEGGLVQLVDFRYSVQTLCSAHCLLSDGMWCACGILCSTWRMHVGGALLTRGCQR
jgi:hypothetical protein